MRYTLLSDGSSDRVLMSILTWLLREHLPEVAVQESWADLRHLPDPPRSLTDRINVCLDLYPCDLLFIHRDAENESPMKRRQEIESALDECSSLNSDLPAICVIPVRMMEAWLLTDEQAIRAAAGNPGGRISLDIPAPQELEDIRDPKKILYDLLKTASDLQGRRLKKFRPHEKMHRITDFADDFSVLRNLEAFTALENDIKTTLDSMR